MISRDRNWRRRALESLDSRAIQPFSDDGFPDRRSLRPSPDVWRRIFGPTSARPSRRHRSGLALSLEMVEQRVLLSGGGAASISNVTATPNLTNRPPILTATAATSKANMTVAGVEYFLDQLGADGTGIAMAATDGSFNANTENATATLAQLGFGSLAQGPHTVHVHARDNKGNWGPASSVAFTKDTAAPAAAAVPALGAGDDTGRYANDRLTSRTTPSFTGAAEPNSTVILLSDGVEVGRGPAQNGQYTVRSTHLADGPHAITAVAIDGAGNAGVASSALAITVDTAAPIATPPTLDPASDSGNRGDNITSVSTPTVSGTAEAGSTVVLYDGIKAVGATTADALGKYVVSAGLLADGPHALGVTATDAAGNVGLASASLALIIKTMPPAAPSVPALAAASDSGVLGDRITSATAPTFTGTSERGTVVEIFVDGASAGRGLTAPDGTYSIVLNVQLAQGPHGVAARATDEAGNTSAISASGELTIDTIPPARPTLDLAYGSDTGRSATDKITGDNTPTFLGVTEVGSRVVLYADGVELGSGVAGPNGTFSITTSNLADGARGITAVSTDVAGNPGLASDPLTVVIDTVVPDVLGPTLDPGSDTGVTGDNKTADTTPTLVSRAEPGSTVIAYIDGIAIAVTTAANDGTYRLTVPTPLAAGLHTITTTASDLAGNTLATKDALVLTIVTDTTAPQVVLSSPADGSTTYDTTPQLSGTAGTEPGDAPTVVVEIYVAVAQNTQGGEFTRGALLRSYSVAVVNGTFAVDVDANDALSGGTYFAVARQSDDAGNAAESAATFTVLTDTTAPQVLLTSPADGSTTYDTTPALSGTAGTEPGDAPTVVVEIYVAVAQNTQGGGFTRGALLRSYSVAVVNGTFAVDVDANDALSGGTYFAVARQSDDAGNSAESAATFTVLTDTTAPQVVLSSPADGSTTYDTTPQLSGTAGSEAGDAPTVVVEIYAAVAQNTQGGGFTRGALLRSYSVAVVNGTFAVDVGANDALPGGTYFAVARQSDQAGNAAESAATFTVLTDTTAPQVLLTSPADGSTTYDTTPALSGTAGTEPGDVPTVVVEIYAAVAQNTQGGGFTRGALLRSYSVAVVNGTFAVEVGANDALPGGTFIAVARQSDQAGNVAENAATFTVLTDTTAPQVVLSSPADGSTTYDTTPQLSGTAGTEPGDAPTVVVEIYVAVAQNTQGGGFIRGALLRSYSVAVVNGTFAVDVDANDALSGGTYIAVARQSDDAGNSAESAATFTVLTDTTAPQVVLTSPADGSTTYDTTPQLSGTAGTEPGDAPTVVVEIYVAVAQNTQGGGFTRGALLRSYSVAVVNGTFAVDVDANDALSGGTYIAVARQSDDAGNFAESAATFTVLTDTTAPQVLLTGPADGSTITNQPLTFSGTAGTEPGDLDSVTITIFSTINVNGVLSMGGRYEVLRPPVVNGFFSAVSMIPYVPGTYIAVAEQRDEAGNVRTSNLVTFTIV